VSGSGFHCRVAGAKRDAELPTSLSRPIHFSMRANANSMLPRCRSWERIPYAYTMLTLLVTTAAVWVLLRMQASTCSSTWTPSTPKSTRYEVSHFCLLRRCRTSIDNWTLCRRNCASFFKIPCFTTPADYGIRTGLAHMEPNTTHEVRSRLGRVPKIWQHCWVFCWQWGSDARWVLPQEYTCRRR